MAACSYYIPKSDLEFQSILTKKYSQKLHFSHFYVHNFLVQTLHDNEIEFSVCKMSMEILNDTLVEGPHKR